ncbi:MAG: hypothetical protein G01um101438_804 [Parcubacteria group bacterium Gr01-1014_38]|nr:MAG: hypothetical protein G01um101438_804 [Parcubacteria group bacterium Gr01-1014_38]
MAATVFHFPGVLSVNPVSVVANRDLVRATVFRWTIFRLAIRSSVDWSSRYSRCASSRCFPVTAFRKVRSSERSLLRHRSLMDRRRRLTRSAFFAEAVCGMPRSLEYGHCSVESLWWLEVAHQEPSEGNRLRDGPWPNGCPAELLKVGANLQTLAEITGECANVRSRAHRPLDARVRVGEREELGVEHRHRPRGQRHRFSPPCAPVRGNAADLHGGVAWRDL